MKKSKIFMTAGALLLGITAMFATKANKKFTSPSEAHIAGNTDAYLYVSTGIPILTTVNTGGTLHTAYAYLYTGTDHKISGTLVTGASGSVKLYFK